MSLLEKIESIRQQPEAVRLRYVWLCVSISMFFVFTLWILSLQTSFPKIPPFKQTLPNSQTSDTTHATDTATEPSLQDLLQKSNTPGQ